MNKQMILLLLALVAAVAVVVAGEQLTDELGENETSPDGGMGGINDLFGRENVLETGPGKLVDDYQGPCLKKPAKQCKTCCDTYGMAYRVVSHKVLLHHCVCLNKQPLPK